MVVLRGEIYSARLDPTGGSELQKTRPCLIVSNDIYNRYSPVVLVAPLTEFTYNPRRQGSKSAPELSALKFEFLTNGDSVALTERFFAVGAPFRRRP